MVMVLLLRLVWRNNHGSSSSRHVYTHTHACTLIFLLFLVYFNEEKKTKGDGRQQYLDKRGKSRLFPMVLPCADGIFGVKLAMDQMGLSSYIWKHSPFSLETTRKF